MQCLLPSNNLSSFHKLPKSIVWTEHHLWIGFCKGRYPEWMNEWTSGNECICVLQCSVYDYRNLRILSKTSLCLSATSNKDNINSESLISRTSFGILYAWKYRIIVLVGELLYIKVTSNKECRQELIEVTQNPYNKL